MPVQNADFERRVRALFDKARFLSHLGVRVGGVGDGWCESALDVAPHHLQQDDYVHAGVVATLADHTAGGAACTQVAAEQTVLTIEFKVNLLRPAVGGGLLCRSTVLRGGRTLIVCESEVFARRGAEEKLVAKATVTLAVVPLPDGPTAVGGSRPTP